MFLLSSYLFVSLFYRCNYLFQVPRSGLHTGQTDIVKEPLSSLLLCTVLYCISQGGNKVQSLLSSLLLCTVMYCILQGGNKVQSLLSSLLLCVYCTEYRAYRVEFFLFHHCHDKFEIVTEMNCVRDAGFEPRITA